MRTRCYCVNPACRRMYMRRVTSPSLRKACDSCGGDVEPTRNVGGGVATGRTYKAHVYITPELARKIQALTPERAPWKRSSVAGSLAVLAEQAVRTAERRRVR